MNKTTKGALAASAAAILLMGGAGSLAYWTAEAEADGGSIAAGNLQLTDGDCDGDWTHVGGPSADDTVELFVPGDEITKQCTFTLTATGDNLAAEVGVPSTVEYSTGPEDDDDYVEPLSLTTEATFEVTDTATPATTRALANEDVVTDADDGSTITATINVTIPFGTAADATTPVNVNDTKNLVATLDALTVSLTQVAQPVTAE
jgi:alternate signal-mediated exported protein